MKNYKKKKKNNNLFIFSAKAASSTTSSARCQMLVEWLISFFPPDGYTTIIGIGELLKYKLCVLF